MTTLQNLAATMFASFEKQTRDNGDRYVSIRDGAPEWVQDVVRAAHADMMPDDFRYMSCYRIAGQFADLPEDEDVNDYGHEVCDGLVDVYNSSLASWLGSNLTRSGYVDEAIEEYGFDEKKGIFGLLRIGQYRELEEVYSIIVSELALLVVEDDEV